MSLMSNRPNSMPEVMNADHWKSWPEWLKTQCQKASEIFSQQGFPTKKNEDWRYTSLQTLLAHDWKQSDQTVCVSIKAPDNIQVIATDFVSALKKTPEDMEYYFSLFFNTPHQHAFYTFNTAL